MKDTHDMVVIGAGPGGYVAALRAGQLGLTVALVEKESIGGVCLNRGCIPTKAILSDVEGLRWARKAADDGILDSVPAIDFTRVMNRKNAVVEKLVTNLEKHLSKSGVTIIRGTASVPEPGVVALNDGETLKAKNVVIATGSKPWTPPIPGADLPRVLNTRRILDLERPPANLVVIGGGIIGQEFATIFATLGCRVTILEALDRIMVEVDSEIARKYASLLPGRGVKSELGAVIHAIESARDRVRVVYEKSSKEKTVEADLVLMATGRRPSFEGAGIEKLGIRVEDGSITVDRFLRTSIHGIHAIGDVVGRQMLAHVASHHGEIVAENIAGRERPVDEEAIPCAVFTHPQIAWVGLNEEQAAQSGRSFRTSTFSLSASGKALAMGESRGWVKLIEDTDSGRLIGAHLMGPHVSELLGGPTLAIRERMSASDIADTIHAHPTISEAVREAALGLLDGPIHSAGRTKSVRGDPPR